MDKKGEGGMGRGREGKEEGGNGRGGEGRERGGGLDLDICPAPEFLVTPLSTSLVRNA